MSAGGYKRSAADAKTRLEARTEYDPNSGCHLYAGCGRGTLGYGQIAVGGRSMGAHRLAYTLAVGPIPKSLHVLHRCDTPRCVNPSHLFLGTAAENAADRHAKGRSASHHGSLNGRAKLTPEQVAEIRRDPGRYGHRKVLAKRFGVCAGTISQVRDGTRWAALPQPDAETHPPHHGAQHERSY